MGESTAEKEGERRVEREFGGEKSRRGHGDFFLISHR